MKKKDLNESDRTSWNYLQFYTHYIKSLYENFFKLVIHNHNSKIKKYDDILLCNLFLISILSFWKLLLKLKNYGKQTRQPNDWKLNLNGGDHSFILRY